ncbi:unnamed protein product [Symbiodinium natans]|uniref:Uncharacterized protein n=1 Tax=Symbiodinium natans TaxID=878477 RepID=A0A812JVU5_9DINO|nr:unnamed protein product [Symbiodinium natans]
MMSFLDKARLAARLGKDQAEPDATTAKTELSPTKPGSKPESEDSPAKTEAKQEPGGSAKRWCSTASKQCSKMEGDLTLELLEYMASWQGDLSDMMDLEVSQHPAAIVPQILASPNSEHNAANCNQIEVFLEAYHAKRNLPFLFKQGHRYVSRLLLRPH